MTALTLHLLLWTFVVINCQEGDMKTRQELNDLFNSRVQTAESVVRPKQGMPDDAKSYFTTHSGVRVTLEDGRKYLIHKGPNYGRASDTVVTPARHMSSRWQVKETQDIGGRVSVGQMTGAAGTKYGLLGRNCHDARRKMMKLGRTQGAGSTQRRSRERSERTSRRSSRKRSG